MEALINSSVRGEPFGYAQGEWYKSEFPHLYIYNKSMIRQYASAIAVQHCLY